MFFSPFPLFVCVGPDFFRWLYVVFDFLVCISVDVLCFDVGVLNGVFDFCC